MRKTNVKRGFTLAEMIVVIAIIALLAVVVIFNVQEGKKKARDAQRLSDLQQIQLALRIYKDTHGRYPDMGCGRFDTDGLYWTGAHPTFGTCTEYIDGVTDFFQTLPIDTNSFGYIYSSRNNGADYKIMAYQSVEKGVIPKGTPFARCDLSCTPAFCDNQATYAIYSPGAKCW